MQPNAPITFKPKMCPACGIGFIVTCMRVGRTITIRDKVVAIPDDMGIPTCSHCHDEQIDHRLAHALDLLLSDDEDY